jgi:four helix bundle protein
MARFIQIAMGSGAELSYHLLLARDLGLMETAEHAKLDASLSEVMRMLSSLVKRLRNALAA